MPRPTYFVIDFETSGSLDAPVPVEVAVVRVDPDGNRSTVVDSFVGLPPGERIAPFTTQLTGITDADLVGAPDLRTALRPLDAALRATPGALLAAHHAPFDAPILWKRIRCCPNAYRTPFVCTVLLGRAAVPGLGSYKLDRLAAGVGLVVPPGRHRALVDAALTAELLHVLLERRPFPDDAALLARAGLLPPVFRPDELGEPLL